VAELFHQHLQQLQSCTDRFLEAIMASLKKMPYGIRYIARELNAELKKKFPPKSPEEEERIVKVIGNLLYYRYMNPAIVAPEGFDVIETLISPIQRKNLAEVNCLPSKLLDLRRTEESRCSFRRFVV
jgi:Ras GTPase-activating-like protein IQGAP2/3